MKALVLVFLMVAQALAEDSKFGLAIFSTAPKGYANGATLVGTDFQEKTEILKEPYAYFAYYKTLTSSFWSNVYLTASYFDITKKDGNFHTQLYAHNVNLVLYDQTNDKEFEYGLGVKAIYYRVHEQFTHIGVTSTVNQGVFVPLAYLAWKGKFFRNESFDFALEGQGMIIGKSQYIDGTFRLIIKLGNSFRPAVGYRHSQYRRQDSELDVDLTYQGPFLELAFLF